MIRIMPVRRAADEPAPLPRRFYDRDVVAVARDLLGCLLLRDAAEGRTVGRIVEVEAYLAGDDPACHSFRGRTRRNASMFGPPGHAYVYAIHARWCFNVVTEPEGVASAVLVRAVEPLEGLERMRRRRGIDDVRDLARGPARLCAAFDIDRRLDGTDLTTRGALWLAQPPANAPPPRAAEVAATPRVGVTAARELPLRFVCVNSPFISRGAARRC
jgi:DNA-3-methyladenine glycosylase